MPDLSPDVERQIAAWRVATAAHVRDTELLDELEAHLRDAADELIAGGHTPEEAVRAAVERLGRPEALASEFAKLPPARVWLPVRAVWVGVAVAVAGVTAMVVPKVLTGGITPVLGAHMGAVTLGYCATLAIGFLAAWFLLARLLREPGPAPVRSSRRTALALSVAAVALTGLGVGCGCFCPLPKRGWLCGLDSREVGGLIVLSWDTVLLVYWCSARRREPLVGMVLGVVGSAVVTLGWFAAALAEGHPQPLPGGFAAVLVLFVAQVAVAGTALAPAGCLRPIPPE